MPPPLSRLGGTSRIHRHRPRFPPSAKPPCCDDGPGGSRERSLGAHRDEWIDPRCAPGGKQARERAHEQEQDRDPAVDERVERFYAEELRPDHVRGRGGNAETDEQADRDKSETAADDQGYHLRALSSKGHAEPDLAGALRDGVSKNR